MVRSFGPNFSDVPRSAQCLHLPQQCQIPRQCQQRALAASFPLPNVAFNSKICCMPTERIIYDFYIIYRIIFGLIKMSKCSGHVRTNHSLSICWIIMRLVLFRSTILLINSERLTQLRLFFPLLQFSFLQWSDSKRCS